MVGKLGAGKVIMVDEEDFERCSKLRWSLSIEGMPQSFNGRETINIGRFVLHDPRGFEVDHKNGNRLDNRKENLRICCRVLNEINKGLRRDNNTGFKGVTKALHGKWRARIKINQKAFVIGAFDTKDDAARAYNAVCRLVYGEYGWLNTFPKKDIAVGE